MVFLSSFSLLPARLAAQTREGDATEVVTARFLLEAISVEGVERSATREIVLQESRLVVGSEVDEEQLRQAIYRIRRLPFVIDADFSLRKGSERGRYELVIEIEMASSVFLELEGFSTWRRSDFSGNNGRFFDTERLGGRLFVGARGYAFGSIDNNKNAQLGYTQFHLFGPGSYLSVALDKNLDETSDVYGMSLSAGRPITARQSVRLVGRLANSPLLDTSSAALEWAFDSTDDPFLPTQGAILSASTGFGESKLTASFGDGFTFRSRSEARSISSLVRVYRPLSVRQSVWGEVSGGVTFNRLEIGSTLVGKSTSRLYSAGLGYSLDLLRSSLAGSHNDLRFALRAAYSKQRTGSDSGFFVAPKFDDDGWNAEASLVFRRPQGLIRLSFFYIDDNRPVVNP